MAEVIMEVSIVVVGLAALGIFVGEVFRPRERRPERVRSRRSRH